MATYETIKRDSKMITKPEDVQYLLSLKEEDIKQSTIFQLFGEYDGKIRFNPFDLIEIPPNTYGPEGKRNKNKFTTGVGIWIFNIFTVEKELFDLFHYVNEIVDDDKVQDMIRAISLYVMEDIYSTQVLENFLLKCQLLMPTVAVLTYSCSEKLYGLSDYITPKKKALIKQYQKDIDEGNAVVVERIEKELIQDAKDYLKDDPAMDEFYSGARSSIPNHLKNMYIMKGAVKNPDPNAANSYKVITSNFNDGVSKEEYATLCMSLAYGPYSRGLRTAIGGYWEKLMVMCYQHIVIGGPNTDCGTKNTLTVTLDKKSGFDWMYSYIVESNGSLTELTSKNLDKYIGKPVKIRFASLCESKSYICNKCASNRFERLGVKNVGVAMGMIASKIKNIAMKAFHDGTVKTVRIDPKKAFGE